ncbi:hypothetical protein ABID21_003948 [Pseudorhizobium tarimense]|uniref:PilZ domain-containing protein n=1 Tax=Pseudorhizobium tarimense TaxID=1079109 RepID=A0ABV2HB88_9HYPH|nr:PilZ domain-containing protein [Pseudorhizobium tarimense]MCJ8520728.1 PilZ domain-containing protein [Pseudorhizobium tarimense]
MPSSNLNMKVRAAPRRKTRVAGKVSYYGQAVEGRIVDLSTTGLALDLVGPFRAAVGSPVKIESEDLGVLDGTVKWSHGGRLGIGLRPNSNAAAQVAAYFRFFHRDVKPVLTR